jgi:hypothetical protein
MPSVTCPGCQKQYKLPDTAVGQVANCKCGKRFRVGGGVASAAVAAGTSASAKAGAVAAAKPQPAAAVPAKSSAKDDDFWDKALSEPVKSLEPVAPKPVAVIGSHAHTALPDRRRRPEVEAADQPKVRWGFDWGKVGGGLATFLIAGGITIGLLVATDRLYIWPAVVAGGGLITCLSGLMGEEGVW